jgi:hypothetical protein
MYPIDGGYFTPAAFSHTEVKIAVKVLSSITSLFLTAKLFFVSGEKNEQEIFRRTTDGCFIAMHILRGCPHD